MGKKKSGGGEDDPPAKTPPGTPKAKPAKLKAFNFRKIVAEQKEETERMGKPIKFCDNEFLPNDESLYYDPQNKPAGHCEITAWKRVSDYVKSKDVDVNFTKDLMAAANCSILQGGLGNYFFIGALSVVATRPDLLEGIMVGEAPHYGYYPEEGLFACQFFKNGKWNEVIVDDLIPFSGTHPAYCMAREAEVVWPMLVEKAYAKAHGCYEAIEDPCGSLAGALADLTGGLGEKVFFSDLKKVFEEKSKDKKTPETVLVQKANNLLWRLIERNAENEFIMCCVADDHSGTANDNGQGILLNHAYAVVDVKEVGPKKENRLVKFKSPWSKVTWTGTWGASDQQSWTAELIRELKMDKTDKTSFWMSVEDVTKIFTKLVVSRFHELPSHRDNWNGIMRRGEWIKGSSAGGSTHHQLTWMNNPQYLLTVHEHHADVFIHLQQPDANYLNHSRDLNYASIGFFVFRVPREKVSNDLRKDNNKDVKGKKKILTGSQDMVVGQTFLGETREVSRELHELSSGEQYIILPCTQNPDVETSFILSVYAATSCHMTLAQLPDYALEVEEHEALQDNAGGNMDGPYFGDNTVTFLKVFEEAPITFLLSSPDLQEGPFCFYIFKKAAEQAIFNSRPPTEKNKTKGPPANEAIHPEDILVRKDNIEFVRNVPSVITTLPLAPTKEGEYYVLVLCTPQPACGRFRIQTSMEKPVCMIYSEKLAIEEGHNSPTIAAKERKLRRKLGDADSRKVRVDDGKGDAKHHRIFDYAKLNGKNTDADDGDDLDNLDEHGRKKKRGKSCEPPKCRVM